MTKSHAPILLGAMLLAGCVPISKPPAPVSPTIAPIAPITQAPLIMAGKALAEEKCQTCHAVGIKGDSENPMAPPLRVLAQNYPIEDLSEAFAEGILIGHSEMPEFRFEPAQLDALLAYIESIQEPAAKPGNAPKAG